VKRFLLLAVFFYCQAIVFAQMTRTPVSVIYPSLTTYSTQFKDAFSASFNSAALGGIKQFSAGIFSERRFLLEELSSYSFAAALPTASGNFGIKGHYYGGQNYHESTIGFGYGRTLGEKLAVGLSFNYHSLNAAGYGAASVLTFDAGLILQVTDVLQTGINVYNPVRMKMGKSGEEKLPAVYSVGLGYDVSPQLFIGTEAVKTEDQPLSINAGFHYAFADKLSARGGISSATSVYYLGFGVYIKNIRIDATASFHPYLGTTPGLLFIYAPRK